MSVPLQQLEQADPTELATTIRNAGLAGAGGAGFPTYAKWERLDDVDFLMMNHQESEPNYYIDKWLAHEHAETFAALFDALLGRAFETIVVTAKEKDREQWMTEFETVTDATVYGPEDLPLSPGEESGVVIAYTDDQYEYGMESVLLRIVADTVIGNDLPLDHGWIVQNTETLFNLYRALEAGDPVTRKLVHVDGAVPEHRFLDVPIGTPAASLLEAAGLPSPRLGDDQVLVDGGPGWCFGIDDSPSEFGVRKRTNCLLVLDEDVVEENTLGENRVNVLSTREWDADHETEPTRLDPDRVRIPLLTNPGFEGIVSSGRPIVESGDSIGTGEMIAVPAGDGVCNAHHTPIDGEVTAVTDSHVEIQSAGSSRIADTGHRIYWTWCVECGKYAAMPDTEHLSGGERYLCRNCR